MHCGTQTKSGVLVRRKKIEKEEKDTNNRNNHTITLYHLTAVPKGSTILPGGLILHNSLQAPEKSLPPSVIWHGLGYLAIGTFSLRTF